MLVLLIQKKPLRLSIAYTAAVLNKMTFASQHPITGPVTSHYRLATEPTSADDGSPGGFMGGGGGKSPNQSCFNMVLAAAIVFVVDFFSQF